MVVHIDFIDLALFLDSHDCVFTSEVLGSFRGTLQDCGLAMPVSNSSTSYSAPYPTQHNHHPNLGQGRPEA